MEFLNIGGGEILVIILLALLLFGPEDIMNIMRTIGKYTRAASRAWSQLTAGLQGEVLPDEIQQAVDETKSSLGEVKATLDEVGTTVNEVQTSVKAEVSDIDEPLKVEMPDTMAEVLAEAKAQKAGTGASSKAGLDRRVPQKAGTPGARPDKDSGVKEILALVDQSTPKVKKTEELPPPEDTSPSEKAIDKSSAKQPASETLATDVPSAETESDVSSEPTTPPGTNTSKIPPFEDEEA